MNQYWPSCYTTTMPVHGCTYIDDEDMQQLIYIMAETVGEYMLSVYKVA